MPTFPESGVTPREVARFLFRHWRKITLIFSGVIGLTLLLIAMFPRSYGSEAKLMIRIGRESVGLDPTATTGETIMLQKTQEEEVKSAVSVLTSREVFERVAERIGTDRILKGSSDSSPDKPAVSDASSTLSKASAWLRTAMVDLRLSDPGTTQDQAIRRLERGCVINAPKQSTVISIKYSAISPQLAHDVVEAVTSVFVEEYSKLNQSEGSLEFFSKQVQKLFDDLTVAQERLRDRKNEYQLTTGVKRRSVLESSKDAIRQKVSELEKQEMALMSRYKDEYPPLREIRRQRELAQEMLTAKTDVNTPGKKRIKSDESVASSDKPSTQVNTASYQAVGGSEDASAKLNAELQSLNEQEFELAQLEREVKLLGAKYEMHVEKLEQARINDALGRERISNVKIVQPASLVYKPVSPNKALFLGAALIAALIGGLGSAFISEGLDQTLRTTDQVERQLGLPVLASLPYRKRSPKQLKGPVSPPGTSLVTGNGSYQNGSNRVGRFQGLVAVVRSFAGSEHNTCERAKTIGIVGCDTAKLRSQVAGNLAIEAALSGTDPILLIDADARHQRVAKRFQLNGSPGWRDAVSGNAALQECFQQSSPGNLSVMGPGAVGTAIQATGSPLVGALARLEGIKTLFSLVVVDLPPTGELASTQSASEWVDEAVLVVEAERTRIQAAKRARDMLQRSGVRVLGVVLANRREYVPDWLYQRL